MLKLRNICKDYPIGNGKVTALKDVSVEFRKSEFVSILGPSGCGKTTLLNIIGGLDKYSSGNLIINGRSTKKYKDSDWDTYRNHSVGFVFQNYNLIPHQSVLSNVELSLTLTGVSKTERKMKAKKALNRVGLGDQLNKKPNQMSGGQMQRVAIARALINDPDILLADEPTGALDSETSIQIMELLKEISKDTLVIMVTHNPELANEYSTRIINLFDGKITNDTNPYDSSEEISPKSLNLKKPSMSFLTAFSLSCNNLLTKKARTILTSFAGSIGIIGIALILSLSNGVNAYINGVEEDTLSSYPIAIQQMGTDVSEMIVNLMGNNKDKEKHDLNKIYSNNIMSDMITTMINGTNNNDLAAFKKYIESNEKEFKKYTSDIKYSYSTQLNIYNEDGYRVNPSNIFKEFGMATANTMTEENSSSGFMNTSVWQELLDNKELLENQYDVIAGNMPSSYDEVVLIVDENNEISDYALYSLGLMDIDELKEEVKAARDEEKEIAKKTAVTTYTYDDILNLKFKLLLNTDYYVKNDNGTYTDNSEDELFITKKLETAKEIKVAGILRAKSKSAASNASGTVGYLKSLMTELINSVNESEIVKEQKAKPEIDVITGLEFNENKEYTMEDVKAYISSLPPEQQASYGTMAQQFKEQGMTDKQIVSKFSSYMKALSSDSTYENNLIKLGASDLNSPSSIIIYPKDFDSKEAISDIIKKYNKKVNDKNKEISYTDYIGIMLSSVSTIINAISYILIAFVSISLIVSSIMIGIITYISVLERTKEIGVLRALGASKHDISRVFNAETTIEGLASGLIGIGITVLLLIPINAIIESITDIAGLAILPTGGAIALVIISVFLTFIAGLIPSKMAARKDPVTALRTE